MTVHGKILVVLLTAGAVSGCVVVIDGAKGGSANSMGWQARQELNRSVIPSLATGTSLEEVQQRLGEPEFTELFSADDGEYRTLFYRTHHVRSDGRTTRDETTPLVFLDGRLVGVGDDFYRRLVGM